MKVCYISHPYTAETEDLIKENIRLAEEFGKQIALLNDYAVIIPHKNTELWHLDDRFSSWSHEKWVTSAMSIMTRCDVVAFCGKWVYSKGCLLEHKLASVLNKDLLYVHELLPDN